MKKKIFVIAATLSLICVTGVLAQEPAAPATPPTPPTPEQMAQAKTKRLTERLNLTEDQASKVYDACLKQSKEQQALFEKMSALHKEQAEKMKSILTTEQFMQWSQMQRPGAMGPRGRQHEGCPKACMKCKAGQKKDASKPKDGDRPRRERGPRK